MVCELTSKLGAGQVKFSESLVKLSLFTFALLSECCEINWCCCKTWSNCSANPSFHSLIFLKACFSSLVA